MGGLVPSIVFGGQYFPAGHGRASREVQTYPAGHELATPPGQYSPRLHSMHSVSLELSLYPVSQRQSEKLTEFGMLKEFTGHSVQLLTRP